MQLVGDATMETIELAMDALAARSEVIAQNVANADVPGFHGSQVSFESELREAVERGDLERFGGATLEKSRCPADATGNNVSLEDEVVEMLKTSLLQEAMVEAFNFKAGLLRSALRAQ